MLDAVITSVQSFFSGDTSAAIDRLKSMDFDTAQLGELALNMSMSKSVEMTRGYHNGSDRLHDLMEEDADVASALEFIASEQKRLIDVAGSVLDRPSSAKLVRSLLPPLMSEPFAALESKVNAARNPDETIEAQALLDALGTTTEEMVADASELVKDVMPLDGQADQ